MIKFWKSAAKGKSGCPVRPPEPSKLTAACSSNSDVKTILDIPTDKENTDNLCTFEKKSKLSLNLWNILVEKKSLKYFILYMESISKIMLVECWLELDNFRSLVCNSITKNYDYENQSKLSRTKSFDLQSMGDPVFRKKKRNHSVPDMTIDSNQLYNADALWQRKKNDGLSLGRVNSLGRFESKFEPDPDKKDRSVLKKMVSRFVPTNTSKVEEEMAWQIAHMIVKDVTDLTMAPPDNEDV
ncbi:hypothetical protein O0L34_g7045 [Tuta absoluta]|nr:hypothetical protein O0L34_g7045 [Tuta absoluta]